MLTITIFEDADTPEALADMLRHIAALLDQGYTSGIGPNWSIFEENN